MNDSSPDDEPVTAAEQYMAQAHSILSEFLSAVFASPIAHKGMDHRDRDFGFTDNPETFTVASLTRGNYHLIGTASNSRSFVAYQLEKAEGYGIFDDDTSGLLPLEVDDLIAEIKKNDDPIVQQAHVKFIGEQMLRILTQADPDHQ